MRRFLIGVFLVMVLVLSSCATSGSGSTTTTHTNPSPKIVRQTRLADEWQMYQIEATLAAGTELPIIIEVADGGKAEGYFYVEKGDNNIAFRITGISQIYQSDFQGIPAGQPVSDRFSFTATQVQGQKYEMTLQNNTDSTKNTTATVFFEVIYSGDSPLWIPLEIK